MIFKKRKKYQEDETNRENPLPEKRESKRHKNPIKRWRFMVFSLFTLIGIVAFGYGAISYASSNSFCVSCHEMTPQHATFEASAHNQIKCTQCHIKPGRKNQILHKVDEIKGVYTHFTATSETITKTAIVSSENCEQCHSKNRLVTAAGDTIINHEGHIEADIPCVTCHSGVAHAKIVEGDPRFLYLYGLD
ncbi:cytochrome c3 family protein [Bacillus sp. FJAT-18017]|uniref:cytochrome c3 family protein n=1 Tax=Bacillus sp. FJAT-18017 TaxID=1705566 RepID=UPI0006AEA830|nr:NapC/NirT family cytochrome c [Bacillus sp. FJAT-18017]